MLQRLGAMETAVESVQMDVRQLTDERDNIRSTFNDLTLNLIHNQVSSYYMLTLRLYAPYYTTSRHA